MYGMFIILLALPYEGKSHPVLVEESYSPQMLANRGSADTFLILFVVSIALLGLFISSCAIYFFIAHYRTVNEEDLNREEENQAYLELDLEEQELYFQSKDYLNSNPYVRGDLTLSQKLSIQEKGIRAWEFVKDPMLTSNDLLIVNKNELNFFKKFECSAQSNLPIPSANEVYYFESKIYSLPNPEDTIISIGIGVMPYPWFRLPGRHAHTISYDSNGYRRHNQPFKFESEPPFPKLIEGDVVGVGYRTRNGTVFFTRNGKKVSELKIGGHVKNFRLPNHGQIFPIVGANNLCSVHVNLGQLGYVFIEGNVKKWGFAPLEGSGPAPPAYNKFNGDILLERSEIDDDNDLAERENDFPPDFWQLQSNEITNLDHDKFSYNAYSDLSADERITMHSLLPNVPPSYDSESHSEDAGRSALTSDGSSANELPHTSTLSLVNEPLSQVENTQDNIGSDEDILPESTEPPQDQPDGVENESVELIEPLEGSSTRNSEDT